MVAVFPGPPQVGAVGAEGGDAVGADDRAVQVEMGETSSFRVLQHVLEVRRLGCEHLQSLVEAAVGGGEADAVVAGELGHAGAVDEPAQDQHRLPEAGQRAAALTGTQLDPSRMQELGQVLGGLPADIEHGSVGDTG